MMANSLVSLKNIKRLLSQVFKRVLHIQVKFIYIRSAESKSCSESFMSSVNEPPMPSMLLSGYVCGFVISLHFSMEKLPKYHRLNEDGLVRRRVSGYGTYMAGETSAFYVITDECIVVDGKHQLRRKLRLENSGNMVHVEVSLKKLDGKEIRDSSGIDEAFASSRVDLSEVLEPANKAIKYGFDRVLKNRKPIIGVRVLFDYLRSNYKYGIVLVDPSPDVTKALVQQFGIELSQDEVFKAYPMEVLDQFSDPQAEINKDLFSYENNHRGQFEVLLLSMPTFESGIFTSPPSFMLTHEAFIKMRKTLSADGVLIMHLMVASVVSLMDVKNLLSKVFERVLHIKVSNESYVILASSAKDVVSYPSDSFESDLESRIHAVKPLWDQTLTMITNLHKAASTTDRTHTHTHCTST
ncbi:hypothetical protein QVD17_36085 [Tagetes erecta]|uniref:Uncharacterized protein n=1 Tax=Tagetes erecta TaxID=13708 RepID=A0AAD8JU35_TARER|nr:hypothetical protein QVD17_36085 [Tagetes erecta]